MSQRIALPWASHFEHVGEQAYSGL